MADAEQVKLLESDVEAWNDWRKENPGIEIDLTGADLTKVYLVGADLRNADLEGAILTGAHLNAAQVGEADLTCASLVGADLTRVNMERADLSQATLDKADLTDADLRGALLNEASLDETFLGYADLRDASLRDVDLRKTRGLQTSQLGGALTSMAKLPEEVKDFEILTVVKDASGYARKIFLAMLLGCAYTILTIATTTDARLLTDSATSPLPIIQAQIPIVGFYFAAPLILLGFYLYFQLCMQNIWERLAILPAELPDGRTLDKAADPWLLLGLVKPHFARLQHARTLSDRLQTSVSLALAWWAVPLTILLLWLRCLPRHEVIVTSWQIGLLMVAIFSGAYYYRRAVETLRRESGEVFSLTQSLRAWRRYVGAAYLAAGAGLICAAVSWTAIRNLDVGLSWLIADVVGSEVSTKPDNWVGGGKDYADQVLRVRPARLGGRNLRGMRASKAFLVRADLTGADLTGADLTGADLTGAVVAGAKGLTSSMVEMVCANSPLLGLSKALSQPQPCPGYSPTSLPRESLLGANLRGAYLQGAEWSRADLSDADLNGADLSQADLSYAKLSGADLRGAILTGADLRAAELIDTKLNVSDLSGADLRGASLRGADLDGVVLTGANLGGVDLSSARNLGQTQLDSACADPGHRVRELAAGFEQPPPCPESSVE